MIKVKILKIKRFTITESPILFDVTMRSGKNVFYGKITLDFTKKTIRVNFGRTLSDDEQLAVLKEIFYCFCITECKKTKNSTGEHIEEYKFIDENKSEERKSIIEYIMCYDIKKFDVYKRKEKIIANLRLSYNKIYKETRLFKTKVELQPISDFSKKEIEVYKKILLKYLKVKKIKGKLRDISYKYNDTFKIEFPYVYNYNVFYVFEYQLEK